MIYSNVKEIVEHQQYVFDTLWNKSIPSEEKFKSIEDGIQPQITEIIRDTHQMQKLAVKLITSTREEILILFSTANAFYRQAKLRVMVLLEQTAIQYGIKIRILTPSSDWIKQEAQELKVY